ncbi:methionyl-tRNA formyltransferase [Acanthopleuribacter pedis]|uniref:Methionyl-tRNA formyltransferase n=1 Tax=Acanthopleuribacter pedis TaxID=442870 RepID=A0A8J7Q7I3_9BACT|nr:methionyl-tRNA formyltransferase [Acanthopleuribacter pedis]MBO1322132.1 methionyl-tRNA formyltransferase [Acanthopleuribacter pedis]
MKIVYMGTPDFAVPALRALADRYGVSAVFCQPDRPKARSRKPVACPVKQAALELGIEVHQPKRIRAKKWVQLLRDLAPDLIVVAAFGQILPQSILDIPTIDCVNIHASLLPRWRGASPIHHALLYGDPRTGVGIMRMEAGLDTGPVYREAAMDIDDTITREALEQALATMGADVLLETVPDLKGMEPTPQDDAASCYAPIITKDMGWVDLSRQNAETVWRTVRAFRGWPDVYVQWQDHPLKLCSVQPVTDGDVTGEPGTLAQVTKKRMLVACADNTLLNVLEVQPAGKKVMPIHAFINGYKPTVGETLAKMQH